jgi:hypothetical protein
MHPQQISTFNLLQALHNATASLSSIIIVTLPAPQAPWPSQHSRYVRSCLVTCLSCWFGSIICCVFAWVVQGTPWRCLIQRQWCTHASFTAAVKRVLLDCWSLMLYLDLNMLATSFTGRQLYLLLSSLAFGMCSSGRGQHVAACDHGTRNIAHACCASAGGLTDATRHWPWSLRLSTSRLLFTNT